MTRMTPMMMSTLVRSIRTAVLLVVALPLSAAAFGACSGEDVHIDVEVVDDEGNPLAGDDAIRVDCESKSMTITNLRLDDESRFRCQTLNEARPISFERAINFTIRDEAGRFATHEEAAILDEGEVRTFSIQLERVAAE